MSVTSRHRLALLILPLLTAAAPQEDYAAPYRVLQQANSVQDPDLAASAYASGEVLLFDYAGSQRETFRGSTEIRRAYVRTFGQVDADTPILLDFRFEPPGLVGDRQAGVYRLTASIGGKPVIQYGRFSAKLVKERGSWRFAEDRGSAASRAEFERLPQPTDETAHTQSRSR